MYAMSRLLLVTALTFTLTHTAAIASASAEQKIAVVDLQSVLLGTKAGRAAKAQFEGMQKKKKKALQRRDNQLKAQEKKLVQERVDLEKELAKAGQPSKITPLLKAKAQEFQAKARRFQEEILEFQRTQQQTLQDLSKKESELLKPIETKIRGVIEQIAKARGYTVVLNRVAVVYHVDAVDITSEVSSRMGK